MGRIRKDIDVEGRHCWTLFDSGARNIYIRGETLTGDDIEVIVKLSPTSKLVIITVYVL